MKFIAVASLLALTAIASPAAAHEVDGTEVTFFGAVPCSVVCGYWDTPTGFSPCEAPFPPGSYIDVSTSPAPSSQGKVTILEATLDSTIDWDGFLCAGPTGRTLAQGHFFDCDSVVPPLPVGCHEDLEAVVTGGQTVVFRAYNWSDALPATGEYAFWFI